MKLIKKIITVMSIVGMIIPVCSGTLTEVKATDNYEMQNGCKAYEVDIVNNNGGFDYVGCYSSFSDAKNTMQAKGDDAVVRHSSSKSPTKIIAMTNGLVMSYPYRDANSKGLSYYYANSDGTGVATYTISHMQSQYLDTVSYNESNGTGYVNMIENGFNGYIQLAYCDLVPTKFAVKGLKLTLGGNSASNHSGEVSYNLIPKVNVYSVFDNNNYKDMLFTCYYAWPTSSSNANAQIYSSSITLPAADFMEIGTSYYSFDGVNFYSDPYLKNFVGTYYNYYQFLPLRTKTNITAQEFESFLASKGYGIANSKLAGNAETFLEGQELYGVNALMVYSMACIESAYGSSYYAINKNNLFGWGAFDSNPDLALNYSLVQQAILTHMGKNLNGYLDVDDTRFFGYNLGNKGSGFNVKYASAPYWGMSIASIAYSIDKYAGLKDYNSVTLVKADGNTAFRTSTGQFVYDLKNSGYTGNAYLVPVVGELGDNYIVQSANYLNGSSVVRADNSNMKKYGWEANVLYVAKNSVTLVNSGYSDLPTIGEPPVIPEENPNPVSDPEIWQERTTIDNDNMQRSVDSIYLSDDGKSMTITGHAFQIGKNADPGHVSHELILVNTVTGEEVRYKADTINYNGTYPLHDFNYDAIGYSVKIDITAIPFGNYYMAICVDNDGVRTARALYINQEIGTYVAMNDSGEQCRIFRNPLTRYRLEVSVEKQNVDLVDLKKKSERTPIFGVTDASLENGILEMQGFAILRDTSMSSGDGVNIKVLLEDDYGNVTEVDTSEEIDDSLTSVFGKGYDVSNSKFSVSYDLNTLEKGHYRMYIDIRTNDFHDCFEAYASQDIQYNGSSESGTFDLNNTGARNRFELWIQ